MKKQPCLLHIHPYWPSYLLVLLPALLILMRIIHGGSELMYSVLLLWLPMVYLGCQSLSAYPDGLILRLVGIPIKRIPWSDLGSVVLCPAHTGHKGRYVPPMVLAILKPDTITQRTGDPDPSRRPDYKTVSARFSESQTSLIRVVLEKQGCTVVDYEDMIHHDL